MNYLKTITLSLYGLCSLTTLAAQSHIEPPMVTIPAGTFIMGSNTDCVIREFPFGKIEFIMHRGGSYVADEAWSRLFVRGHSGESNPSSLGEGFRLALNIDEMQPSPSKVDDNTTEFQRMLIIAQNKQRQSAKPTLLGANTQPQPITK